MTVYVKIKRLNGRRDLYDLVSEISPKGFDDRIEYNAGGWEDKQLHHVMPHLKFEDEDDALAYILAYGGVISKNIPVDVVVEEDLTWSRAIKR